MSTWTATDFNRTTAHGGRTTYLADKRDADAGDEAETALYEAILLTTETLAETVVRGAVSGDTATAYVGEGIDASHHHTALLWMDTPSAPVSLHPRRLLGGDSESYVADGGEGMAAGYGRGEATDHRDVALLWNLGPTNEVVSIHPAGLLGEGSASRANAVTDRYIIGSCSGEATGGHENALVWKRGPRLVAADIHPAHLLGRGAMSSLQGADGSVLVGYGNGPKTGHCDHALAWLGAADADAVPLHPLHLLGRAAYSYALSVSGNRVVGHGRGEFTNLYSHAIVWDCLNPRYATDLHPKHLLGVGSCSYATGLNDEMVVGFGRGTETDFMDHALLWTGADSGNVVDLHRFAPVGAQSSRAYGIDPDGNILGWIDGRAAIWKRR